MKWTRREALYFLLIVLKVYTITKLGNKHEKMYTINTKTLAHFKVQIYSAICISAKIVKKLCYFITQLIITWNIVELCI